MMKNIKNQCISDFSRDITSISVLKSDNAIQEILNKLTELKEIKFATLWKISKRHNHCIAVARSNGYNPNPVNNKNNETEFFCPIKNTHISNFLNSNQYRKCLPFLIPDVNELGEDLFFNTKTRIESIPLYSACMIPINSINGEDDEDPRHFLNIYFEKKYTCPIDETSHYFDVSINKIKTSINASHYKYICNVNNVFDEIFSSSKGVFKNIVNSIVSDKIFDLILSQNIFLFIFDEYGKLNYFQNNRNSNLYKFDDISLDIISRKIQSLFLGNRNIETHHYFDNIFCKIAPFSTSRSAIVTAIKSNSYEGGLAGAIVSLNALNKLALEKCEFPIHQCFDREAQYLVELFSRRFSLLHDIYTHENNKNQITLFLGHEIMSPTAYIRDTTSRIIRKGSISANNEKSLKELENVHNTSVLQLSVSDGIILSQKKSNLPPREVYEPSEINVYSYFQQLKRTVYPLCENFGVLNDNINVNVSIKPLYMDRRVLSSLFLNLASNAIKYHEPKRAFRFNVYSETIYNTDNKYDDYAKIMDIPNGVTNEGFFLFTFSDYGVGIEKKFSERIFEKYFRIPGISTTVLSGSGLGLSIVKKLLEDHRCKIWLANEVSPTRFCILIPMFYNRQNYTFSTWWRESNREK